MKFTISREKLLEPLQLACGVVERRQTVPILSNVMLTLEEGVLTIVGSDQEVELTVQIPDVDTKDAGEITVPARKFLDICRSIPEGADLQATLEGNRLALESGRFSSHLATLPVAEFPDISVGQSEV